jgi:hypothetical protein
MTNTEQLIVLFTNSVPTASQNTLNIIAESGLSVTSQDDGSVIISADSATSGAYFPYTGTPSGSIPGAVFTIPYDLALATVFVDGLAQSPSSYTQDGETFVLSEPLADGDTIYISGFYLYSA